MRVQAATVNPVDWKFQKGIARPFLPATLPCIPGTPKAHPGPRDVLYVLDSGQIRLNGVPTQPVHPETLSC